jgi:hypothetical protein
MVGAALIFLLFMLKVCGSCLHQAYVFLLSKPTAHDVLLDSHSLVLEFVFGSQV